MLDINERLDKLPDLPGVYIMKDKNDNIIYVGKAKSLRKRVRQYFRSYGNSSMKVKSMVSNIKDFEYIIVENEVESLILESNLIKDNHPKYNILLRDDKQYPYIKITNEKYPRVIKTRRIIKDGAKYFGPYPSIGAVNDSIEVFERIFPLRTCSLNLEKNLGKYRPCLNYFIGKCIGPCKGDIKEEEYNKFIDQILNFLSKKDKTLIKNLESKMKEFSDNLKFEEAGKIRDDINSLKELNEKQIITNTDISDNKDVIGIARGIDEILIQVFFIREGKIIGREHYFMRDYMNNENSEIINAFLKQFYSGASFIPKEIIVEDVPGDIKLLEEFLSNKRKAKVSIVVPQRGDKRNLLLMAKKNALEMLNKYGDKYKKKIESNIFALEEIQNLLGLDKLPKRIEAYDISNTYGIESVGSMVVFENGNAKKSDYRKFKIKSVVGPDDYSSMKEVLLRRFKRGIEEKNNNINSSFARFPDLIMMDGGKGQVNVALDTIKKLKIDIEVCGLIKDEFHNTRGIIYNNKEYNINLNSKGYKMIFKIQEEAHRFAINYHRSLRSKDIFKSELDNIPKVGTIRKNNLMKHFKSIDKIKKASLEELREVESINLTAAESIYNYFRRTKNG
ncbi:MAG: excinuclease ABC subunit UvrC [Peptoniphilaceae bacterium]